MAKGYSTDLRDPVRAAVKPHASLILRPRLLSAGCMLITTIGLHFRRVTIGLNDVLVLAKCKTNKYKRDQDCSAYHQPMRILHCGENGQLGCLTSFAFSRQPQSVWMSFVGP